MASKLVSAITGVLQRLLKNGTSQAAKAMDEIMAREVRHMQQAAARAAARRLKQKLGLQSATAEESQALGEILRKEMEKRSGGATPPTAGKPGPIPATEEESKALDEIVRREMEKRRGGGGAPPPQPGPPSQPPAPAPAPTPPPSQRKPGRPRKTTDIDQEDITPGGRGTRRVPNNDPTITGEMVPVRSSNVHSIGFEIDPQSGFPVGTKGTLLIRFLGGTSKERGGPGTLYEYYNFPASLFRVFLRAASKGKFVWDEVRVRGTISGHKYSYSVRAVADGYVPRQAGLKRGQSGEWYLTRRFRDADGNLLISRLPEQRVRMRGPNPQPGPGLSKLILKRGTPNRGGPNRGSP
jgi:hypothetical protein